MTNKTKKPLFASGLYIALSLCVLAVIAIGAYSAVNQLFFKTTDKPITQNPLDELNTNADKQEELTPDIPIISPEAEEDDAEDALKDEETSTEPQEDIPIEQPETSERIFMSPVTSDKIAKEFKIEELLYSATMNDYRTHSGIDIACEVGSAVSAFTDGVVESIHADPLMGQTIVLDHGDGLKSIYQNLSLEIPDGILAGVEVHAGDLIGAVGETAIIECAEEPHLHFEVMKNDSFIDPGKYLK